MTKPNNFSQFNQAGAPYLTKKKSKAQKKPKPKPATTNPAKMQAQAEQLRGGQRMTASMARDKAKQYIGANGSE